MGEETSNKLYLLNSIINATPDLIFYKDYLNQDGIYIGCNQAFCEFVGKEFDQIVGYSDNKLFGEDMGEFFRQKDREVFLGKHTKINREWVNYPDGREVYLESSKSPFYDESGRAVGVVGISRDITAEYDATQKIKDLNERMELALLGNHDGVWDWNLVTNEVYYSPRWKEMLGYRDSELPNQFSSWQDRVHPDDFERVYRAVEDNIAGKSAYVDNQHRLKHKNGSWVWVHVRAKTIFDEEFKAVRMSGTHTDISLEKERELQYLLQSQMIDQTHDSVISVDLNGIIQTWNQGSYRLLGYSAQEAVGKHVSMVHRKEDIKEFERGIEVVLQNGSYNADVKHVKKNGEEIDVSLTLFVLKDENKEVTSIVGYAQDISIRKKAERALVAQKEYLQSIINGVEDPIMVINEDYTIRTMNKTLKESLDTIKIADPKHPKCYEVSHHRSTPCDGVSHPCPLKNVLESAQHTRVIHKHDTRQGLNRSIELLATPFLDDDGKCIGIIESARDITEHLRVQSDLKEQKDILDYQAHHDGLTGLPNRVLFEDRLHQSIEKSKRMGLKTALLFIDLDHFKEINDSLGHLVGDEVLKSTALRLRESIRDEDTLARLGGDEFTIILENLEDVSNASLVAKKILKTLKMPIMVNDNMLYISSSIGISIYPDDGGSAQNLIKFADSAMYKAKDEGRSNYQYYNSRLTELAFERVFMEASLREAVKNEEFEVYYQPQVNGVSSKLVGMEALVRWIHPTMGVLPPSKFIGLAETTGIIVDIDKFVMKKAMIQLSAWYKSGLNPGVLAMNLAIKQLSEKNFFSYFKALLDETGCKAEWIELEITEGQIMTHPEESIEILHKISELGVELAIDDFGTGYSSLAYLKRLPIDKLKIDKAFIDDVPDDEEATGITKAVIALAQSLNLRIIAEGVETKEQKEFVVRHGCQNIQGYFYSKPVPAKNIEEILKNANNI